MTGRAAGARNVTNGDRVTPGVNFLSSRCSYVLQHLYPTIHYLYSSGVFFLRSLRFINILERARERYIYSWDELFLLMIIQYTRYDRFQEVRSSLVFVYIITR